MTNPGLQSIFTLADKILFLFCSILVLYCYYFFWQSTPAAYAIIKSPQQDAYRIDLQTSQTHQVKGALGTSTIEVTQGQVRFTASACQNKLCIKSGWHQHNGAVAACLPNRVSIQLASTHSETSYDAINF